MTNDKLSAAQRKAIAESFEDGTIQNSTQPTERALISRGLAVAILGTVTTRRGTYRNAYQGARLTEAGHQVRAEIR